MTKIVIIQGHPDPGGDHLCHALAGAYGAGAEEAGHSVTRIELAQLRIDFLRSQAEQEEGIPNDDILDAQEKIRAAEHLVFVYPLWLGGMPALLKAFLEQAARPGFAYDPGKGPFGGKLLSGRSARVIITMGMPAWWYRLVYRAASLQAFRIGILNFVGIRPVHATLIGLVGDTSFDADQWLMRVAKLGTDAA
ncbi:NAD(P)H-dependent oxidoreductase [Affinirhizobium pseudoryzae]|uniref:NAD(P)H-dependent oxidoreductase n=1 Tax=Allorhizobium pseudoryzae TaxID=379684 RepID=UPI0013E9FACA|nr:NAD(P)H-dependent oxidoreductase [Allorhizobium pseudoryzae]